MYRTCIQRSTTLPTRHRESVASCTRSPSQPGRASVLAQEEPVATERSGTGDRPASAHDSLPIALPIALTITPPETPPRTPPGSPRPPRRQRAGPPPPGYVPRSPRQPMLRELGRQIEPVYGHSALVLHTTRAHATAPPDIEAAPRLWQLTYNYCTGAGVYASSFAIGSLASAAVSPLNPLAAGVLFDLVAPLLHGSMGEAVGMMIRKNRGAAYSSPDTDAWRACSDALADWLQARCAGDRAGLEDACERFNTEVIQLWRRWGRPAHTDALGDAHTIDLRAQLIDLRTPLKAMGMGFLVDEVAFAWFAIAYAGAGRVAVELLRQVAQGAREWGLREAYRFSFYNFLNHLAWGAGMGGSFTTVQQNAMRSLVYPDAVQPDGGVHSTQARERKIAALRDRIQVLRDHHTGLNQAATRRANELAPLSPVHDEEHTALCEAMKLIEAAVARREAEITHLQRQGELSRLERDDQTFRANMRTLFSPPLRRNQIARLAGNVACLMPYVASMTGLAATNAAHARQLVAAQHGGPAVTAEQAQQVALANTFMGSRLIGFWYGRTLLQTGFKFGYGIGAGLYQRCRGTPADEVMRMPPVADPPPEAHAEADTGADTGAHRSAQAVQSSVVETEVGPFFMPDSEGDGGEASGAPVRIRTTLEEGQEELERNLADLHRRHGPQRTIELLTALNAVIKAEIEDSRRERESESSGGEAPA